MDRHVTRHVGQHLAKDDVEEPEVERERRFDVLALLQREDLRTHLAQQARPLKGREQEREDQEALGSKDRRDHDEDHEMRNGEHNVRDR